MELKLSSLRLQACSLWWDLVLESVRLKKYSCWIFSYIHFSLSDLTVPLLFHIENIKTFSVIDVAAPVVWEAM